jgi:hypothetical protein
MAPLVTASWLPNGKFQAFQRPRPVAGDRLVSGYAQIIHRLIAGLSTASPQPGRNGRRFIKLDYTQAFELD